MKALDILKHFRGEEIDCENTLFSLTFYDEAITELEALQEKIKELEEPKTCEGCITNSCYCYECSRYCTDFYEGKQKDNQ